VAQLPRWAVVHWIRFDEARTAGDLHLAVAPQAAISWKVGPDWSASDSGIRSGSRIWCGLALFDSLQQARDAFAQRGTYLPDSRAASEVWSALLTPFAHKGECNHLNRAEPGLMFEVEKCERPGPMFVITTAGFHLRSRKDFQRVINFRREVDRMRPVIAGSDGNLAHQVFAPLEAEDDGVTMSLWRDERAMLEFAYKPGAHRMQVDRQKSNQTVDRSSFTRFRLLRTKGTWGGSDPATDARGPALGAQAAAANSAAARRRSSTSKATAAPSSSACLNEAVAQGTSRRRRDHGPST
jgi:heme-degrading monooxygenase HmoA